MLNTNLMIKKTAIHNGALYQLTDQDIQDIQKLLLGVLQDVDYVCEKYHLSYSLCGGSALGAVRHQGFIPWDEDIDICMPRRDYDRFRRLFLREFSHKYWVQNTMDDHGYDLNFMKIRVKNTTFLEMTDPQPEYAGCFLDIFPLENTYDQCFLRMLHGIVSSGLLFITSCVRIYKKAERLLRFAGADAELGRALMIKKRLGRFFSVIPMHFWMALTECCLSICRNQESRYLVIPTGRGHFFGEIYPREALQPFKRVAFETESVCLFKAPEVYLKTLYGDYMRIPPEAEREKHCVAAYNIRKHEEIL